MAAYQVWSAPRPLAARAPRRLLARAIWALASGRKPVMAQSMQPLSSLPDAARRAFRGVLTDIDDTLSTHGRITAAAYAALSRLRAAGLLVVPITGRPAGWCDHIARMWPVDAVVGENGALYMRYDAASRRLVRRFADDEPTRCAHRARLASIGETILAAVPGCALASDQHYRET